MENEGKAGGIVALLTDFGTSDHFAGSMKGSLLSIAPGATIVDITHEVGPQDISSAGFLIWAAYRDFPPGTVFVCVVDPGVGSERRRIIVRSSDHQFVAPDNGLLTLVLDEGDCEVFELGPDANLCRPVSGTFDGRDFFAPVGARLASGERADLLGKQIDDPIKDPDLHIFDPGAFPDEGSVLHIDRFGNLITNLRPEHLASAASISINGNDITEKREFFGEGPPGGLFLITGSAGLVEVCSNRGSASEIVGAKPRDRVLVSR